jgi:CBS domain-containing protein
MRPNPICVDPRTPVRRAANLLRGRSIGCLPVVDSGQLIGIVTISDVLELVGRGARRGPSGRVDHAPLRRAATDLRRVHVPGSR